MEVEIDMNKTQLIDRIAEECEFTKADASRAVEAFQKVITEGLKEFGKITLIGFGTLSAKERPARVGRNPRDGSPVNIPASVTVGFKAGNKLKDALNS